MTGTYVGIVERTGEHVLVGANGRAVRVRTVKRAPAQLRWTQKPILEMKATPRRPDPSSKAPEIKPMLDEEQMAPAAQPKAEEFREVPRVTEPRDLDTRELRLTRRLLEKFGYAPDCEGCIAAQGDLPRRNHRASCQERMYKAISADAE